MTSKEMASSSPSISKITSKGRPKRNRFVFTIERDIILLETALNLNPWQLGGSKWTEIAEDLSRKFRTVMKERTVKERLTNLISKLEKQELETKTGTEEQQSKRGELLQEIIAIKEAETSPINNELGAECELEDLADEIGLLSEKSKKSKQTERFLADAERDSLLKSNYSETPPEIKPTRTKRTKALIEEDLIVEKAKHDMDMEAKRFKLDEMVKEAEIKHEDKRLEIELLREKRLAEENKQRNQLFEALQKSLELMNKVIEKKI